MVEVKARRNRLRHGLTKAKTTFNELKVVRRGKGKTNPTVEGVQRHFCMGLQRNAWARPRAGGAHT